MGQTSSVPSHHWRTRLIFTSQSLSDNVVTCPDLGLLYRIFTPRSLGIFVNGPTSISRWDPNAQRDDLIAEMESHSFSQDRVRVALQGGGLKPSENGNRLDGVPFVKEGDFLMSIGTWSIKRTFQASNGRFYVWRMRDGSLQLFTSEDKYTPIAKFSTAGLFSSSPMHIKLAQGSEEIVDEILVTGIIMEKRRRRQSMYYKLLWRRDEDDKGVLQLEVVERQEVVMEVGVELRT